MGVRDTTRPDAWVTFGGVGSQAKQTIIATTDGGRTWSVLGPEPLWCELDFVATSNGWCAVIGAAAGSATVALYRIPCAPPPDIGPVWL